MTARSACMTASRSRAATRMKLGPRRGSIRELFLLRRVPQDRQKCLVSDNGPRRTLLLTGASRGIGHATVKRFSAAGWRVITCSRHPFPENCPWEAGPEDHIQVDLGDPANTADAIEEIKRRLPDGQLACARQQRGDLAEGGRRRAAVGNRRPTSRSGSTCFR